MGKGSVLAKIDIKSTYQLVPILLWIGLVRGMCWNDQIYMDSKLPFGLWSAPKIFTAVSRSFRMVHGKGRGAGSVLLASEAPAQS